MRSLCKFKRMDLLGGRQDGIGQTATQINNPTPFDLGSIMARDTGVAGRDARLVDHEAMVRYLAGETRLPSADVDRIVRAFTHRLEAPGDAEPGQEELEVDLASLVRAIVGQTILPPGQATRTIQAMLDLRPKPRDPRA